MLSPFETLIALKTMRENIVPPPVAACEKRPHSVTAALPSKETVPTVRKIFPLAPSVSEPVARVESGLICVVISVWSAVSPAAAAFVPVPTPWYFMISISTMFCQASTRKPLPTVVTTACAEGKPNEIRACCGRSRSVQPLSSREPSLWTTCRQSFSRIALYSLTAGNKPKKSEPRSASASVALIAPQPITFRCERRRSSGPRPIDSLAIVFLLDCHFLSRRDRRGRFLDLRHQLLRLRDRRGAVELGERLRDGRLVIDVVVNHELESHLQRPLNHRRGQILAHADAFPRHQYVTLSQTICRSSA